MKACIVLLVISLVAVGAGDAFSQGIGDCLAHQSPSPAWFAQWKSRCLLGSTMSSDRVYHIIRCTDSMLQYPSAANLTRDCVSEAWSRSADTENRLRENTCVLVASSLHRNELCRHQNATSVLHSCEPGQRKCRFVQKWSICACTLALRPSRTAEHLSMAKIRKIDP
jgi:hypothetical protein